MIEQLMEYNKAFVEREAYRAFAMDKRPNKKIAILTCMDARLTQLLPSALGLKNGDAKIIQNAGAMVTSDYGSVMRSLLVAVYQLGVEEVLVIGHTDCGMEGLDSEKMLQKMKARGIAETTIEEIQQSGVDLSGFLRGFEDVDQSVVGTVRRIAAHPLMPKHVSVYGCIMQIETGKLVRLC